MMMMQATPRIARQETVRLSQLEARRDEIREQLESVTQWRGRLVQERHNASATNNQTVVRELDGRIAELGERSNRLEREMLSLDDQIAGLVGREGGGAQTVMDAAIQAAIAGRGAATQTISLPPRIIQTGVSDEAVFGIMAGEALVFVLLGIVIVRRAFRRGKAEALASGAGGQGVAQLQQSVDAIALEVERISENQRFVTKLLNEGAQGSRVR